MTNLTTYNYPPPVVIIETTENEIIAPPVVGWMRIDRIYGCNVRAAVRAAVRCIFFLCMRLIIEKKCRPAEINRKKQEQT